MNLDNDEQLWIEPDQFATQPGAGQEPVQEITKLLERGILSTKERAHLATLAGLLHPLFPDHQRLRARVQKALEPKLRPQ